MRNLQAPSFVARARIALNSCASGANLENCLSSFHTNICHGCAVAGYCQGKHRFVRLEATLQSDLVLDCQALNQLVTETLQVTVLLTWQWLAPDYCMLCDKCLIKSRAAYSAGEGLKQMAMDGVREQHFIERIVMDPPAHVYGRPCFAAQVLTEIAGETLDHMAAAPRNKVAAQAAAVPEEEEEDAEAADLQARLNAIRS